jgi:hypothetical protein
MRWNAWLAGLGIVSVLLSACATQDAALVGAMVGRTLGMPVGTVATAVDETFRTAADVVKENPRHREKREMADHRRPPVPCTVPRSGVEDYYYRAEVLVKTRGPAQIESLTLQETEDVSEFWRR